MQYVHSAPFIFPNFVYKLEQTAGSIIIKIGFKVYFVFVGCFFLFSNFKAKI